MEPLNNSNNNNMTMNSFDNFTTNNVVNEFIPLSNPNPNDTTTTFSCDALLHHHHHHQRPLNINPFDESTTSFINPDPPFYDPAAMLSHHHHHFLPTTTTFDQEPINTGLKPISEFGSSSLIKSSTPPSFRDNIDINNKSHRNHNNNNNNGGKKRKRKNENSKEVEKPREVVHVRARRGQATDSHSLAERLRREKINDKLRSLQDLVPGCYKTMGMAVMLDVIINYIRSLQNQIEFLSMKLSAASMFYDFNSSEFDAFETVQLGTSGYEAQVMERMVGDQGYGGFSHHFQSSTNWSL